MDGRVNIMKRELINCVKETVELPKCDSNVGNEEARFRPLSNPDPNSE